MSEAKKMNDFVDSGASYILSDFYDWFTHQGYQLMRWEQVTEEFECPSPLCKDGQIQHRNPDPYLGWTTQELPEFIYVECTRCNGLGYCTRVIAERWGPRQGGPEELFAEYAGIDLERLDEERREMLRILREGNA